MNFVRTLHSANETAALAEQLGRSLSGREVVALNGPLGAGKTLFVQGLARGLGCPADEPVVSPTFVLMREYQGRLRLVHFDWYRISDVAELRDLGWDELLAEPATVIAVEWAERFPALLPETVIRVHLEHESLADRTCRVENWPAPSPR